MGKIYKYWILLFAIVGFTFVVYSQGSQQGPPEPQSAQSNSRGPCGQLPGHGDGPGQGNGPGIPPPVGLCLPINDYLLPLLLSGIALGSIWVWKLEKSSSAI